MGIVGSGVDIVEVDRIEASLEKYGERFRDRIFTAGEIAYCDTIKRPAPHYAARFAAKEAICKALGTGIAEGVNWVDLEVIREESGRPVVCLHGHARDLAASMGIVEWSLSISHTHEHAVAQAIAMGVGSEEADGFFVRGEFVG